MVTVVHQERQWPRVCLEGDLDLARTLGDRGSIHRPRQPLGERVRRELPPPGNGSDFTVVGSMFPAAVGSFGHDS